MDTAAYDSRIAQCEKEINDAGARIDTAYELVSKFADQPWIANYADSVPKSADMERAIIAEAQSRLANLIEARMKLAENLFRVPKAERHSVYKQSTADVHSRRYLTDVSVHLAKKCKLHVTVIVRKPDGTIEMKVKTPEEVTMGDVFHCFGEKDTRGKPMYPMLCQIFGHELGTKRCPNTESIFNAVDGPWRYLKALNVAVNEQLHCGLGEDNGEARFICKDDFFQSSLIQQIWAASGCLKRDQSHGPPKIVKLVLQKESDISSTEGSPKSDNNPSPKLVVAAGAIPLCLDSPAGALAAAGSTAAVSVASVPVALATKKKKNKKGKIKSVATECSAVSLSADSSINAQVSIGQSLEPLRPGGIAAVAPSAIASSGIMETL